MIEVTIFSTVVGKSQEIPMYIHNFRNYIVDKFGAKTITEDMKKILLSEHNIIFKKIEHAVGLEYILEFESQDDYTEFVLRYS